MTDFPAEVRTVDVRTVPWWPAAITLVAALLAAVLVPLTLDTSDIGSFRLSVVGYVLGAIVVPVGVAVHRFRREEAKRSPYYDPRYAYDKIAAVAMAVGVLSSVWHAFVVATELAR